jgi:hypothetical protein
MFEWLCHSAKIAEGTRADLLNQVFGCTVRSQRRFGQLKIEDLISRQSGWSALRRRERPGCGATRRTRGKRAYQAGEERSSCRHRMAHARFYPTASRVAASVGMDDE